MDPDQSNFEGRASAEETPARSARDTPGEPVSGPVALITGGGQGIGRGTVDALLAKGWRVHVNARNPDKREAVAASVGEARAHGGDLVQPGVARSLVDRVLEVDGRLDGVVHAVGPYATAPLSGTSLEEFRALWEGNVATALELIEAARAPLRDMRGAYVFFGCAGLSTWRARSVTSAYISAKAALLVTVRALALEEAAHGVRANMISPGFVPHPGAAPDTLSEALHGQIPLGRAAHMEEITGAVRWLLSEEAAHIVGQNIEVSGGWML